MGFMNTKDIKHLANLSRLHLEDSEIQEYTKQFDEIVSYVDKIKEFSIEEENQEESNHSVHQLREDIVICYQEPEKIINEAPNHQDNFVQVKKILKQE